MKYLTLILFSLVFNPSLSQELYLEDGIFYEKPRPRDTTKHKYTLDNISYKLNSVFIFDYYYLDTDGVKKKFIYNKNISSIENPLNLVPYESSIPETIDAIKLDVLDQERFFTARDSNYNQTVSCYTYLKPNGKPQDTSFEKLRIKSPNVQIIWSDESGGIVDNKKNLWIHPPRLYTFKILQLNPFPFYCLDETISNWSWNLSTGGYYLDPRWIEPQKLIQIHFSYIRKPDEIIETPLGKLKCKVTEATGTLPQGDKHFETHLKSYYYPDVGFVRLEYTNVNGTKLFMWLTSVK